MAAEAREARRQGLVSQGEFAAVASPQQQARVALAGARVISSSLASR